MGPWTRRQGGSFGGSFLSGWPCWAWASAVALSFLPATGGEASLWDIPINSSTQGPILEQLQLQHKVSSSRLTWQRLAEAGAASLLANVPVTSVSRTQRSGAQGEAGGGGAQTPGGEASPAAAAGGAEAASGGGGALSTQAGSSLTCLLGLGWGWSQWATLTHCPHAGAAAGTVAEAATAAAGDECPCAPCTQLPTPTLGWPSQAGPVHEDSAGAADGKRAPTAQAAGTTGASAGPGPQPPSGEHLPQGAPLLQLQEHCGWGEVSLSSDA